MRRCTWLTATLLALASGTAVSAPDTKAIKSRLTAYENEARALSANMPMPNQASMQTGQRRLVDAQIAFASGDYDAASLTLFELVGQRSTTGADRETALFYLAESLHHKGDRGAARGYLQELLKTATTASRYYVPALVRLVEIAIIENDTAGGEQALSTLGGVSAGLRGPAVPYAQGKWAFAQGKYDDAIGLFNSVPRGSEYELQAAYYTATAHVAKQDLGRATEIYTDLVGRKPRTNTDRRVIELAQLALGRIYYEREQPSKSIDAYLLVDRRSDLFPVALYEVGWVYVKSKQYDKALVALELLGRLDPQSTKAPTVKILEGNLRIRKAQLLRQAQVEGRISTEERSDPPTEYAKAEKLFSETHDAYLPSYVALQRMADGQVDAASFLDQISGRTHRVFASATPIPEAAAQWLREEPEVQRVVSVEQDLALVQRHINESAATITRLEGVLATGDRLTLYPVLSSRRMRIAAIQHGLVGIRNELAEQALRAGASSPATQQRRALAAQYAGIGAPERAHGERTSAALEAYDDVGESAHEVERTIMETQAMAVALRTYAVAGEVSDEQRSSLTAEIDAVTKEARAIEDELAAIDDEIALGKDLSGVGDAELLRGRALRAQLIAAQNAEHQSLASSGRASALADQAARLAMQLEATDAQIDGLVARGIEEIKSTLAQERTNIAEYQKLLDEYEAEAREVGAPILASSFKDVKERFYDIIVRTDVGNVDVAWSQKEDNDDDLKRLGLAKSRDLKQLRDSFRFILDESMSNPGEPRPAPQPGATDGNPESGAEGRIKPAGEQTRESPQPVVRPDNDPANKPAPTPAPRPAAGATGGSR
jgi:tetratricopeptide (TPR) repeat protein